MMMTIRNRPRWGLPLSLLAALFGVLTIRTGGLILFVDGPDRVWAGAYVPFVLWFNFAAGFFYVVAAIGIFLWQPWAKWLAAAIALATLLVFIAFGVHIAFGGAFEPRTVGAMVLRTGVWTAIAVTLWQRM